MSYNNLYTFSHYKGSLSDFGVRKYEDFSGRFMQPEPLWEKFYGWSPYVYSANNPLKFVDPNGKLYHYEFLKVLSQKNTVTNAIANMAKSGDKGEALYNKQRDSYLTNINFFNKDIPETEVVKNGVKGKDVRFAQAYPIIDPENPGHIMSIRIDIDLEAIKKYGKNEAEVLEIITEEFVHAEQFTKAEENDQVEELYCSSVKRTNYKKNKCNSKISYYEFS